MAAFAAVLVPVNCGYMVLATPIDGVEPDRGPRDD
jgi:hypothetical protein